MSKITKEEVSRWIRNLVPYLEKPQILAPEGFFKDSKIDTTAGQIIEYGDSITPSGMVQVLTQTENLKALVELYKVVEDDR